jgi:hypothetical protein
MAGEIPGLAGEVHFQPGQVGFGFGSAGPAMQLGRPEGRLGSLHARRHFHAMPHGKITGAILEAHKPL